MEITNNSSGYSNPLPFAQIANGDTSKISPFMLPKEVGLNILSRFLPNQYFQTWDTTAWRQASDDVLRMGNTRRWSALITWVYQISPFVQGLFEQVEAIVGTANLELQNELGEKDERWNAEITEKNYFKQICKEVALAKFWGFTGLNFDIEADKCYKYPMSAIEPINRLLKKDTYLFTEGAFFDENDNLLFIQPSTNDEKYLGWMQTISRAAIQMNEMANSWIGAGRRLAYPIPVIKYPQNEVTNQIINGLEVPYNPAKLQAERVLSELSSQNGIAVPYVMDSQNNLISMEIEFAGGNKGGNGMQSIYSQFLETSKKDILQMIFGESLSTDAGKVGSQALGNVQNEKRKGKEQAIINEVISIVNSEILPKIVKFYKTMPKGLKLGINKTKKYDLEEIQILSTVLMQNGKRLSNIFFEQQGISPDFIEETPEPTIITPINNKKQNKSTFFDNLFKKKS